MNVGDYVRTKEGKIGKIINYIDEPTDYYFECYVTDLKNSFIDKYITEYDNKIKLSSNIIDLIEVGDYVNGHKVIEVDLDDIDDYGNDFRYIKTEHDFTLNHWVKENEIESIVTHEQFKSIEYKVRD